MASIWDKLFTGEDYRTAAPSGGYADLYANSLLGNRTDTPTSVQAMETGKDFIPGISDAIALKEAYDAASRGDKVAAGLLTAGAALGLIPGAGKAVARPVMAAGRKAADVAGRIEVDPNAVGSLLGNVRVKPKSPAEEIADLLSSGRADDVTDEMLGKLTAQDNSELFDLYQSGATGMDLPMDEASRMARAGDMGFGVEHPLYRGDTVDHPYYQALYDDAIYTSTDPRVSEDYALRRGLISPLIGNRDNFAIDSSFDDFDADGFSEALADAYDSGKSGVNFQSVADGDAFSRHGKVIADTNAFLDPRDIRSRFARFDPRLAHLKNLSAGVGVAPIGLLALREEQKRANEEQYKRGLLQ